MLFGSKKLGVKAGGPNDEKAAAAPTPASAGEPAASAGSGLAQVANLNYRNMIQKLPDSLLANLSSRTVAITGPVLSAGRIFWAGLARVWHRSGGRPSSSPIKAPVAVVPGAMSASMTPADREFLPAAVEILATPPSPIRIAFLWFICFAAVATLTWSYFGKFDIHAIAQGKIQPTGRSKVVQPFEAGKVITLLVENGSRVNAGDVLLELDPTETSADRDAQAKDLEAITAEMARRRIAIDAGRSETLAAEPIMFMPGTAEATRRREESVLAADLAQFASTRESLKAQIAERQATKQRLITSIAAREKLISLSKERVDMREVLNDRGAGSRGLIIEALQQYETQVTTIVGERGQLLETEASLFTLEQKIVEATTQFIAEQTQKLTDAERKGDRLTQELIKAQSKSERMHLRAPIGGTVQQLGVTTIGQVVTGGQALMTIVPLDAPIEIEAMILNQDIGFVELGQQAVVKVDAFPFTRYGTIEGTVVRVSQDAVDEKEAGNLSDAQSAMTKPQGAAAIGSGSSPRTQNLVFPATIALKQRSMSIDGKQIPLSPGMAVTVEIRTGERRAIDYVLSPLREATSRFGSER